MQPKTRRLPSPVDFLPFASAFLFVCGLLVSSALFMTLSIVPLALGASLHIVSFARPVTHHFRKDRPAVRHTR